MASKAAPRSQHRDRNVNSKFLALPIEVKLNIIPHLSLEDAKQVRFISESWAAAGRDTFFKSRYHIRPHRTDLTKLTEICDYPELAKNIRPVEFWIPDFDKHRFLTICDEENAKSKDGYTAMLELIKKSQRGGVQNQYAHGKRLHKCFSNLLNLKQVLVRGYTCPFTDPLVRRIWRRMLKGYTPNSHWRSSDPILPYRIYTQPILAAIRYEHIEWLDVWTLPIEAWIQVGNHLKRRNLEVSGSTSTISDHDLDETNVPIIPHIKTLCLHLQQGSPEIPLDAPLARNTIQLLSAFRNLRHLQLSGWISPQQDVGFIDESENQFSLLFFPHLESIDLGFVQGLSSTEQVCQFLYRHKATLKNLAFFKDNLSLEKFYFRTVSTGHRPLGEYKQRNQCTLYDEKWKERPYKETDPMRAMNLIELYVCGKIDWPLVDDEPKDQYGNDWEPKIRLTHAEFTKMSMHELNLRIRGEWHLPPIVLKEFTHQDLVNRVKEKRKLKLSGSKFREADTVANEEKEGGNQSEEKHGSENYPNQHENVKT
ncbi:hypothetical protein BDZ45DRAFT_809252 [Acephala macrosclerotiorum]|nr:hypothetical protein BDZ45DRAFT_809252 [Acephala macrosclerotiorum]